MTKKNTASNKNAMQILTNPHGVFIGKFRLSRGFLSKDTTAP